MIVYNLVDSKNLSLVNILSLSKNVPYSTLC